MIKIIKDGKEYSVRLVSLYNEYNCAVKMCGRLGTEVKTSDGINHNYFPIADELRDTKIKDNLIKDFIDSWSNKDSFKPLKSSSQVFPNDSGTYLPSMLLYADRVDGGGRAEWYNNWRGLINLFESEPKWGVRVFKLPVFSNRTYGVGACASRVWGIIPPPLNQCVLAGPITDGFKGSLKSVVGYGNLSPSDHDEIKQAIGV